MRGPHSTSLQGDGIQARPSSADTMPLVQWLFWRRRRRRSGTQQAWLEQVLSPRGSVQAHGRLPNTGTTWDTSQCGTLVYLQSGNPGLLEDPHCKQMGLLIFTLMDLSFMMFRQSPSIDSAVVLHSATPPSLMLQEAVLEIQLRRGWGRSPGSTIQAEHGLDIA